MKYTYAYKTSDGVRHEDSMNASSREEVFEALRAKGIKAIKVVAADGSKANGEVRGVRKRVVAAVAVAVALAAGTVAYLAGERQNAPQGDVGGETAAQSPRHQIYGDPEIMSRFEHGDFNDVLPRDGDRLLAIFAQPGKVMCAKGADPRRLDKVTAVLFDDYAKSLLAPEYDLPILPADSREAQELKQIVNGMREEMREYLANGNGTAKSFWRRLNERTLSEMQIYERTRRELEKEKSPDAYERKNDALRRLGLRTIPHSSD